MKKILIIEDDPIVAHIYRTRLEKEGYQLEVAQDGQTGFYRIHEFRPDAVLLDLMLPKMNGVDILKKIRAQGQFCKTPIIVFTNAYVPNMIHESFGAGATQVFNKATVTPRQILDAIYSAIYPTIGPGGAQPAGTQTQTPPEPASPPRPQTGAEPPFHPVTKPGGTALVPAGASSQAETKFMAPAVDTSDDDEFQNELLTSFMQSGTETLTA